MSESIPKNSEEASGLPKILIAPIALVLAGLAIWVGPSQKQIKISSTTGRHHVTHKIWGIGIQDGPKETEVSKWMAAQGVTMPEDYWINYQTVVKPAFGKKREAIVPSATIAINSEKFLQALKNHPEGPQLLSEMIALNDEGPSPDASKRDRKKFHEKNVEFRRKVLSPDDKG